MRRLPIKVWGFALGLAAALVLVGCGTSKKQWLGFFFDGVPGVGTNNVAVAVEEDHGPANTNASPLALLAKMDQKIFFHVPYNDHQCNECHESKYSQKLKGKLTEVCFACHDDFLEKAKFKHPPAEGECTACHSPHQSVEPKLLVQKLELVCADCHEPADMAKVKSHLNTKESCLTCHDPHAGKDQYFLKPAAKVAANTPAPAPKDAKK